MNITHPNKVLFPKEGLTKQDLLDYYLLVSHFMLPLIKNRPVTMHRFPQGINKQGFIQKNLAKNRPKSLKVIKLSGKNLGQVTYLLCNSKEALIYLVNQACIPIHITLSQSKKINNPDRLIFDLDFNGKDFSKVKQAAFDLKVILEEELQLKSYVMTTGSKGLHIWVPIRPTMEFDQVREFAKNVAALLVSRNPKDYTLELKKSKRRGRVFIDYLRNGLAQTAVAPYSIRATPEATIAMPLNWNQLKKASIEPKTFTLKNIKKYLSKNKNPWTGIRSKSQGLSKAIKKLSLLLNP